MSLREELALEYQNRIHENQKLSDEYQKFFVKTKFRCGDWTEEQDDEFEMILREDTSSLLKQLLIKEYLLDKFQTSKLSNDTVEENLEAHLIMFDEIPSPFSDTVSEQVHRENPNRGDILFFLGEAIDLERISHGNPKEQVRAIKEEMNQILLRKGYLEEEIELACKEAFLLSGNSKEKAYVKTRI